MEMNPEGFWHNKVIVITGSANGIGKELVDYFLDKSAKVVGIDLHEQKDVGHSSFLGITFNLSKVEEFQSLLESIVHQVGFPSLIVNNARSGKRSTLLEETVETWGQTLDVGLRSASFLTQCFIKLCRQEFEKGTHKNVSRSVINISSVAATHSGGESLAYHVAKSGLESMTRFFAANGGRWGVRVNAIRPGFIVQKRHHLKYYDKNNTDYLARARFVHPVGTEGSSLDVAETIAFLGSDAAKFISGQCINVDGGLCIQDPWALVTKYNSEFSR